MKLLVFNFIFKLFCPIELIQLSVIFDMHMKLEIPYSDGCIQCFFYRILPTYLLLNSTAYSIPYSGTKD